MVSPSSWRSVLLADPHFLLIERMRNLMETTFDSVFVVSDRASLLKGLECLQPPVVVLDVTIAAGNLSGLIEQMKNCSPDSRSVLLTMHESVTATDTARTAGVHAVVLKRLIGRDLMPAVDAVLRQERFVTRELDPALPIP